VFEVLLDVVSIVYVVGFFFWDLQLSLSLSRSFLLACCVAEIFLKYFLKLFVIAYSFRIDHHSFFVVFAAEKRRNKNPETTHWVC
jgi:hypothetical protein